MFIALSYNTIVFTDVHLIKVFVVTISSFWVIPSISEDVCDMSSFYLINTLIVAASC